jgi:transcriptional regulator GlxA family with amidase domain
MAVQKVAIVIHHGVQALDVAGPVDVFFEANAYIPAEDRYETVLVAADRAPLRASNNMQMVADLSFEEASDGFDILLIAGGAALPDAAPDPQLLEWLRLAPWRASFYGSICTGAFALGHAGCSTDTESPPTGKLHTQARGSLPRRQCRARPHPCPR